MENKINEVKKMIRQDLQELNLFIKDYQECNDYRSNKQCTEDVLMAINSIEKYVFTLEILSDRETTHDFLLYSISDTTYSFLKMFVRKYKYLFMYLSFLLYNNNY